MLNVWNHQNMDIKIWQRYKEKSTYESLIKLLMNVDAKILKYAQTEYICKNI